MSKTYKLVVSPRIEFDVKFSLNDGGTEKPFGMRLAAQRQPLGEQAREFSEQIKVKEFLEARGLVMLGWIGKAPLVGENDEPVPAGPEALNALYDLVVGMVELVFASYQQANGAKGRTGN
jgi:hypothetical protein